MEWIASLLRADVLSLLIPIIAIVGAFSVAALRAHHKHQERIARIKRGYKPDF